MLETIEVLLPPYSGKTIGPLSAEVAEVMDTYETSYVQRYYNTAVAEATKQYELEWLEANLHRKELYVPYNGAVLVDNPEWIVSEFNFDDQTITFWLNYQSDLEKDRAIYSCVLIASFQEVYDSPELLEAVNKRNGKLYTHIKSKRRRDED